MVEVQDVQDYVLLHEWLEELTAKKGEYEGQRISLCIEHRAAMRVLPLCWHWAQISESALDNESAVLSVLRASIVSSAAVRWPIAEFREVARAAEHVAREATALWPSLYSDAARAAVDAVSTIHSYSKNRVAGAPNVANRAYLAHLGEVEGIWSEVRGDATAAITSTSVSLPLWSGENPLAEVWSEVKSATMSAPEGHAHWSFWRRWYDDALKGGPPSNPVLLKAIALIEPEDWDKGPGFINDVKIPELQAEQARNIACTAAEIVRDNATGVFKEVAVSDLEDGLFSDARVRANEAIADFRTFIDRPQSPYGAFADDLDVIENQIARSVDRPIRCYEDLADAMLVILDIAKDNGLETDSRVTRLIRNFERSRRDLRADDNNVAAREAKRIRIGYDELMAAQQEDFRAMLVGFAEKSNATLKEEMTEDEAAIASPETLPDVRDRALFRSSERAVQMEGIERDEAKAKMSLDSAGKAAGALNNMAKAGEKGFDWFRWLVDCMSMGGSGGG